MKTHDPELLKKFVSTRPIVNVILEEPIDGPCYLSNIAELIIKSQSDPKLHAKNLIIKDTIIKDVLLFNAEAEIKEVKTNKGMALAVVGVDFDTFRSFRVLRDQQRKAEREMKELQQELDIALAKNNIKPFAQRDATVATETNISR